MIDFQSNISIINWPQLTNQEIAKYYNEIKANKVLNINWKNPGRIDPDLYNKAPESKSNEKESINDSKSQEIINSDDHEDPNNLITGSSSSINNLITTNLGSLNNSYHLIGDNISRTSSIDINNKFDIFDEFNSDIEKNQNEFLELRLTHSKNRTSDKKVACMDKILDDIRKKYENEQKNINEEVFQSNNPNMINTSRDVSMTEESSATMLTEFLLMPKSDDQLS